MPNFETLTVYIGLGSNQGDPEENLNEALSRLETYDHVDLEAVSSIYETEPQGLKEQPWFKNQIAKLRVESDIWSAEGLLSTLLAIEAQMGRVRTDEQFAPRPIDIDILIYGDLEQQTGFLDVPHPRMTDRAFVLVPLKELDPDLVFPDGTSIDDALRQLTYRIDGNKIWQE